MNAMLIEEHPLLRLGLLQLLESIHGAGNAVALAPGDIPQVNNHGRQPELLVFGMHADTHSSWRQLDRARSVFGPARILILADAIPLQVPPSYSAQDICGCLPKTATLAVIEAAVRMATSGIQGILVAMDANAPTASRSALPSQLHGGLQPTGTCNTVTRVAALSSAMPGMPGLASAATVAAVANVAALAAAPARVQVAIEPHASDGLLAYDEAEMLKITPRQYEVLVLLARGYPIKTVSRMLNISVATVKSHACTLYQRLKVRNKGEAVYAALQRGATLDWVSGDDRVPRNLRGAGDVRDARQTAKPSSPMRLQDVRFDASVAL